MYKAIWRDKCVAVKYIEQESEQNAFTVEVFKLTSDRILIYVEY